MLRDLRTWTQIESGLERNPGAYRVWRAVNDWARGTALKMNLDLNDRPATKGLPAGQAGDCAPYHLTHENHR